MPKPTTSKPNDQIAELVKRMQDDLIMRRQLSVYEKDKLEYQQALDQLNNAMHAYKAPHKP